MLMHKGGPGCYLSGCQQVLCGLEAGCRASGPTLGSAVSQQGHPYRSVWRQTARSACWWKGRLRCRVLQPAEAKVKVSQRAGHATKLRPSRTNRLATASGPSDVEAKGPGTNLGPRDKMISCSSLPSLQIPTQPDLHMPRNHLGKRSSLLLFY